jgi:hypothetical protein
MRADGKSAVSELTPNHFYILEFAVKSAKNGTRTLSSVQNRVRFKNKLQNSTLAFKGVKLKNAPLFVPN